MTLKTLKTKMKYGKGCNLREFIALKIFQHRDPWKYMMCGFLLEA